jgi:acyl-CoA synthetase (NDP forming)
MPTWTDAQLASIHKMLNPRSIAVVGATPRLQYGGRMLAAALKAKDRVNVYPVNPRYDEIMDTKCYPSVADLPEAPDMVGIVVPYERVLDVLRESHQKGAGSAIVISAGFAERGVKERRDLQEQLGEFARESGLRVSGPNCLGVANLKDDIWASASSLGALGLAGPVGLVCQSGASAFGPFLARAVDAGIGFTYLVSTGNEADLDFADFVRYLLDDDSTRVIAGFVEGFKDARKFVEVARLAAQRGKPIVLIKIGRSELGARAAVSHTAALTGIDALYDAAMSQHGVIRVQDYDELLEVSQLLAQCPQPAKQGIAVVSHSGGISSLTADMCGQAGLELPPLTEQAKKGINSVLKGFGWAANPADVTGFAMGESFPEIMGHMIDEPDVGTMVVASSGGDGQAEQVMEQRDRAFNKNEGERKGVVFLWTGSRTATDGLDKLKSAQIPVFYTPSQLASGLSSYLGYYAWRDLRLKQGFGHAPPIDTQQEEAIARLLPSGQRRALSEHESKQLLTGWDVPVTREVLAGSVEEAVHAARTLGYPVVMKVDSSDIPHKTEAGVVRLDIEGDDEVRHAYEQLMLTANQLIGAKEVPPFLPFEKGEMGGFSVGKVELRANAPDQGGARSAIINRVLVQEMVSDAVEVIVGVSYDTQLGPVLLFGTGGVMVEVYNDFALRLCPITSWDAREMIAEVKGSALLHGFRGRPTADLDALVETLVRVSHLAVHLEGKLAEMDINPLMVLPTGLGVKAADALVVLK